MPSSFTCNKCLAPPSGNPGISNWNCYTYSMGEPTFNTYIIVLSIHVFYFNSWELVTLSDHSYPFTCACGCSYTILPKHHSAASTLSFTLSTSLAGTTQVEYINKVSGRLIRPSSTLRSSTCTTLPAKT